MDMKSRLSVQIQHNKQKVLQMVGASDYTVDTQYEEQKQNYQKMLKSFMAIQAEMKKLQKLPAFGFQLDSLAESLNKFFEEDPNQAHYGLEYRTTADEIRKAISDFNDQYTHLQRLVEEQVTKLSALKMKMQERDTLQLEYDAQRHKLKNYQEKAQKDPTKFAEKLQRAEEKFDKRKEAFETANEKLINDIADLHEQRFASFESAYKMMVIGQYTLFARISESYTALNTITQAGGSKSPITPAARTSGSNVPTTSSANQSSVKVSPTQPMVATRPKGESKPQAKVMFDYQAIEDGELSLKIGDIITILERTESGWNKGELHGHTGIYPSNYTEEIKEAVKEAPKAATPVKQPQALPSSSTSAVKLRSNYNYQAAEDEELSMKEGDVITLIEKIDENGWWKGELNGKIGIFPSNFVTPISTNAPPVSQPAIVSSTFADHARALFDYIAQESNELSFKVGDIITVTEKIEPNGWWKGQLNGKEGLFPSNYTQVV